MDFLLLQLADSSFPVGGFVHSQGLEAASAYGAAPDLEAFVEQAAWQTGFSALPFVRAGAIAEMPIFAVCDELDALLTNPVANRASRAQGRNLLRAVTEAFADVPAVGTFANEARPTAMHHAPLFGAVAGALDISARDAQRVFLFGSTRNLLSAAVRLGRIGPLEAQRIIARSTPLFEEVLAACSSLDIHAARQTAPVADVAASLHDRLYARLFQS